MTTSSQDEKERREVAHVVTEIVVFVEMTDGPSAPKLARHIRDDLVNQLPGHVNAYGNKSHPESYRQSFVLGVNAPQNYQQTSDDA